MTHNRHFSIYAASCIENGGIIKYDLFNGTLAEQYRIQLDRPMYLELNEAGLNVVLRETFGENSGLIRVSDNGSKLKASKPQNTYGKCAAHFCTAKKDIYCTNYLSGSVVKIPDKIVIHKGHGLNPNRQSSPHPHFICQAFDGLFFVCDLGVDKIYVYTKNLEEVEAVSLNPGCGPRHLAINTDKNLVYCANELSSTVTVLKYKNKKLTVLGEYNTIFNNAEDNFPAAIRFVDHKLYISNRGDNSISIFNAENQEPVLRNVVPCGGTWPRDINIFGNYLLCANEMSNNISIFNVNGYKLDPCGNVCIEKPLCIVGKALN